MSQSLSSIVMLVGFGLVAYVFYKAIKNLFS